ncbi:MAG: DUF4870 domain-containing protein [Pirellula sp.]
MNDVVDPKKSQQWAMFMHLSLLLNFIIPLGGVVAPIVMWQMKKDELPGVDQHGKNIVNFIISMFIYSIVSFILTFVVIGVFLFFLLLIAVIVLPIIAGIKANNGETWKYPLTLELIK